jgi:hypothetical protein
MNIYNINHLLKQEKDVGSRIKDPGWQNISGSGINILDPQHCKLAKNTFNI